MKFWFDLPMPNMHWETEMCCAWYLIALFALRVCLDEPSAGSGTQCWMWKVGYLSFVVWGWILWLEDAWPMLWEPSCRSVWEVTSSDLWNGALVFLHMHHPCHYWVKNRCTCPCTGLCQAFLKTRRRLWRAVNLNRKCIPNPIWSV